MPTAKIQPESGSSFSRLLNGRNNPPNRRGKDVSHIFLAEPYAILRKSTNKRGILEDYLPLHPHGNDAYFFNYG